MKVVFDTNIIIDAAMGRPGSEKAQELIEASVSGEIYGIVTANTITDIHFIVKKKVGEREARFVINNVLAIFDIAQVDGEICSTALNTGMADYEDSVLAVCAAREEADYIATGDRNFTAEINSPVPAKQPGDILALLH